MQFKLCIVPFSFNSMYLPKLIILGWEFHVYGSQYNHNLEFVLILLKLLMMVTLLIQFHSNMSTLYLD